MIKISERLKSLTKYIFDEDKIMDVGCDHALLDIYLIQDGHPNCIYICDVNPKALQNGIDNVEKYDLEGRIKPVLSYGIERLIDFDVNTLVISGMGSKNIIDILSSPNINQIYKLVLQSNNNHYELRKFLTTKGFNILAEEVIKDGKKTYINIVAGREYQVETYTEKEYEFGPLLIKNEANKNYFEELLAINEKILLSSKSDDIRRKVKDLEEIIESMN